MGLENQTDKKPDAKEWMIKNCTVTGGECGIKIADPTNKENWRFENVKIRSINVQRPMIGSG